jgi:hypothetical protein
MNVSTCNKYRQALEEFRELCRTNTPVSASDFASERSIDRGFVKRIARCGFIHKKSFQLYQWTGKPINADTLQELSRREESLLSAKPTTVAANDPVPVQQPLDLNWKDKNLRKALEKLSPATPTNLSRVDYEALEHRVASLEQLLIRRGVA